MWNNTPDNDKLRLWKSLRTSISGLVQKEKLEKVAEFFSRLPFGSRTIDYYTPTTWPSPWEILFHGSLCKSSISILMFDTLIMDNPELDIELYLINDGSNEYLLPVICNTFVLNYELGSVNSYSDICNEITVLQKITKAQIKQIV